MKKLSWLLSLIVLAFACQEDHVEKKNSSVLIDAMTSSVSVDCTQGAITDVIIDEAVVGTVSVSDASTDLNFELDFTGDEYFLLSDSVWAGACQAPVLVHEDNYDPDDEVRSHSISIPLANLPECGCVRVKLEIARINPINTTIETYIWEQKVEYCRCPEVEPIAYPLSVSVSIRQLNGSNVPAEAKALIYDTETQALIHDIDLEAGVNVIDFKGDPDKTYLLEVSTPGYYTDFTHFVYNELTGDPSHFLAFFLTRTLESTMIITGSEGLENAFAFEMGFIGTGSLQVDWGDGVIEDINVDHETEFRLNLSHDFSGDGQRHVEITGDVDLIVTFINHSTHFTDLYLEQLTELKYLEISNSSFDVLNVDFNPKIETLSFTETSLNTFILGENKSNLTLLNLESIDAGVADKFISELYTNTIARSVHGGHVSATDIDPGLTNGSKSILEDIETNYGWTWSEN